MAIPSLELQRSIYSALTTNSTYKVYEITPLGSFTSPFISLGEESLLTSDTKTDLRYISNYTIHTWTKGASSTTSKTLNNFVVDRILRNPFTVNGFSVDSVTLSLLTTQKEIDETQSQTIFHGIIQFEIIMTQEVI
jgi:hypothetical protein